MLWKLVSARGSQSGFTHHLPWFFRVFIVQSFEPVPGKAGGAGPWIFQDISSLVRCSPRIISWVVNTPFGIDIICKLGIRLLGRRLI